MQKKEARALYRKKRSDLSEQERIKMDDLMLIQFQSIELPFIDTLLSYWPIEENNEPDTHLYTEFLKFRNPELTVCYPVSDFTTMTMEAVISGVDTPFVKTDLNIHEPQGSEGVMPQELDMVFVPLLAFDEQGFRVGYGKGFYDRYLSLCKPSCIKVGFCYFEPFEKLDDTDGFDMPLDICITPHNAYVF